MKWNWQQKDWGQFSFDAKSLRPLEDRFLQEAGRWQGQWTHLPSHEQDSLRIDLLSQEALQTSRIEGEILDRASVQSSIRRLLGLSSETRTIKANEYGISELTVSVAATFEQALTHQQLFSWHEMLTNGRRDLLDIGRYRTHPDPMQIVSGPMERPHIHFEAPPSTQVPMEMENFLDWFHQTGPMGDHSLPALTRAGLTHIYFESIHPFEDGNGRIGRALVEKVLAQAIGQPSLIMLSDAIDKQRKAYYHEVGKASESNEVDKWLAWFAQVILDAQLSTQKSLDFLLFKTQLLQQLQHQLNARQEKVLLRLFSAGHKGFEGGLSAKNYQKIAKTSPATATRDLVDLVEKGALKRTGERKYTRYYLPFE